MARRSIKRFPFYASVAPSHSADERIGNVEFLRNTILQSAQSHRINGWNKGNFLRSLSCLPNRYLILTISIVDNPTLNSPRVFMTSGEDISLDELVDTLHHAAPPFLFLFIHCPSSNPDHLSSLIATKYQLPAHIIVTSCDSRRFAFAIGCELVNWWDFESCLHETVTYAHISDCVHTLLQKYALSVDKSDFTYTSARTAYDHKSEAWTGGIRPALHADIETFQTGSRHEQVADTIKRVMDCASHPRNEHTPTDQRLISSQGLFWLAELSSQLDVDNWLLDTQLLAEVAPELVNHDYGHEIVPAFDAPQGVIHELLNSMVHVPAGVYEFGSTNTIIESEPPAHMHKQRLPAFKIALTPLTVGQWNMLVADPKIAGDTALPVTQINWFQAEAFCKILTKNAQFLGLLSDSQHLRLPTELEWEAAAGGTSHTGYPWGDTFDSALCNCDMSIGATTPVGTYSPEGDSAFKCVDMSGNVREWTCTYAGTRSVDWAEYPDKIRCLRSTSPVTPMHRVIIRGGSYSYSPECVQVWVRNTQVAVRKDPQTGFRIVEVDNNG